MCGVRVRAQLRKELVRLDQMVNRPTEVKSETEVDRLRNKKMLSLNMLLKTTKCIHLIASVVAYLHFTVFRMIITHSVPL